MQRQDQRDEARRLFTLTALRPVVLSLAVGLGVVANDALSAAGREAGVAVLLASYALTGMYFLLWARRVNRPFQVYLQILVDAGLVTVLVAATGGPRSQYVLLYPLLILYASLFASFKGAVVTGLVCSGAYVALSSSSGTGARIPWSGPRSDGLVSVFFTGLLFVAAGILGGFLARRAEQKDEKLKDARLELERIQLGTDVILESIGSGIMSIDSEGRIVHFNKTAAQILGLEPRLVKNRHYEEALGHGMAGLAEQFTLGLAQGTSVFRGETTITSRDGRTVPLGVNTSLIVTDSGARVGVVALYQDLTEAKRQDEKAKRQETLAALGAFSAGIAHEIRNCVSPIVGSAELLKKEPSLRGDARRLMGLIVKETDRLEVFLNELLFYARSKPLDLKAVDLQGLIRETLEVVKRHPAHSEGRTITHQPHEAETWVRVDPEQMKRVFVNLAVNGLQALECGGDVVIRTRCEDGNSRTSARTPSVVVEFEDNGVGIPEETMHRILEPFYSTKGSGTGLGLSIAQRVVERHDGRLSIESRLGMGTKVGVHVPGVIADRVDTPYPVKVAA
ncbi:MAG: PAS domain S-box protein [Candidatus Eisenbacteria bacterium]|nr:PAS domain S-box protein [Candidatus Eisenbacteria bacterium]